MSPSGSNFWKTAHGIVEIAKQHGVAIVTEKLKYLRKARRGDGSGKKFRSLQHQFAYRSLLQKVHAVARREGPDRLRGAGRLRALQKVHAVARREGVEVIGHALAYLEKNAAHSSTIGMLKYAPQFSLTKDVAAAFVLARRGLGFKAASRSELKLWL